MERRQSLVLHHGKSKYDAAIIVYIRSFDCYYKLKQSWIISCCFEKTIRCHCPGGGHGNISCLSGNTGYQVLVCICLQSSATKITQDARPKMVDALLMIIFKMGLVACRFRFCLWRWPMLWLCITMTKSRFNYMTYKTKNCLRSVDAHFATGVSAICNNFISHS